MVNIKCSKFFNFMEFRKLEIMMCIICKRFCISYLIPLRELQNLAHKQVLLSSYLKLDRYTFQSSVLIYLGKSMFINDQ